MYIVLIMEYLDCEYREAVQALKSALFAILQLTR